MSEKFISVPCTHYNHKVGDRVRHLGQLYEVTGVWAAGHMLLLRRVSLARRVAQALRSCWPFRFSGFWGRVWNR